MKHGYVVLRRYNPQDKTGSAGASLPALPAGSGASCRRACGGLGGERAKGATERCNRAAARALRHREYHMSKATAPLKSTQTRCCTPRWRARRTCPGCVRRAEWIAASVKKCSMLELLTGVEICPAFTACQLDHLRVDRLGIPRSSWAASHRAHSTLPCTVS